MSEHLSETLVMKVVILIGVLVINSHRHIRSMLVVGDEILFRFVM